MEIAEVKAHIKNKSFKNFYIFSGEEWKVQRIYIDQIAKTSEKELRYIDSITDIYGKRGNKAFIQKSYVYVVRDDKELMQNEKLQSQLNSVIGSNILILLLTTIDKRLKFYKTYQNSICEFELLKPEILKKYIQREINLSDTNVSKLMEVCEYDYGRCLLEIDKIKRYQAYTWELRTERERDGGVYWTNECFKKLLKDGIIYQPPKDAIFDFVDAILDTDVSLTFELYNQCLAVGEATMVMLTVLYNNTKAVLQVQSCKSSDIAKSTGLNSWQITNAKKHLNKRKVSDLLYIMECCQESQQAIVTGMIDEEFIMENLLTKIM